MQEMIVSKSSKFNSDTLLKGFKDRLVTHDIEPDIFARFFRVLYGLFSDSAYHKMVQFAPSLPSADDEASIRKMLTAVRIECDEPSIKCVMIILEHF